MTASHRYINHEVKVVSRMMLSGEEWPACCIRQCNVSALALSLSAKTNSFWRLENASRRVAASIVCGAPVEQDFGGCQRSPTNSAVTNASFHRRCMSKTKIKAATIIRTGIKDKSQRAVFRGFSPSVGRAPGFGSAGCIMSTVSQPKPCSSIR
jgi:hypothetical protein